MKKLFLLVILLLNYVFIFAQDKKVFGIVTDEYNNSIEDAVISTIDGIHQTNTNEKGEYTLLFPQKYKKIVFNKIGSFKKVIEIPNDSSEIELNISLETENILDSLEIKALKLNSSGILTIDPKIAERFPTISGGIESIIKTELGVAASRNEMSSQYSVRGGNYDENLVYVNGIEIYRPQLIRAGQQEGLSFINPDLVSSVKFSAGGFEAKYGDKMSSVLDIKYKKPDKFGSGFNIGLLGSSVYLMGTAFKKKLTHISGIRYKTNEYMLNSLENKGEYNPSSRDFQSYISYSFNSKWDINFLANISDNKFSFVPKSRKTNFGTFDRTLGLFVRYKGQEADKFTIYTGDITLNYNPTKDLNYSLSVSGFKAQEAETYDIIGSYSLNELNRDPSSNNLGDSVMNIGVGSFMKHARNYLEINVVSVTFKGYYDKKKHFIRWGLKYRYEDISDKMNEWEILDSAGYSIPYNGADIDMYKSMNGTNVNYINKITGYIQDRIIFSSYNANYEIIAGLRYNYNTYNNDHLISPRISAAYKPYNKKFTFRFSTGLYYQSPFYREIRNFDGTFIENSKAQRSIHFVFGNEYNFYAIGRYLKLTTEIYYKKLDHIIPFEVDNVRIKYYANQRARGYALGLDTKISGQFASGVESWLSISITKTEEDIYDIGNGEPDNCGYIPRPTDQIVNASFFLQDYIPGNKRFKAHINLLYATAFPFGPPETGRCNAVHRSTDYKRVDLGATAVLLKEGRQEKNSILKYFKNVNFTIEIFNLLNIDNTISYMWVKVVPNTYTPSVGAHDTYAVPNHLTGRRINLKLSVKF